VREEKICKARLSTFLMIYDFSVSWRSMCNLVPASHFSGKYEVSIRYVKVMFMPLSLPGLKLPCTCVWACTVAVIPNTFLRRINIFSLCGHCEDWPVPMGIATSDLLLQKKDSNCQITQCTAATVFA
jgi:hypothetical protein